MSSLSIDAPARHELWSRRHTCPRCKQSIRCWSGSVQTSGTRRTTCVCEQHVPGVFDVRIIDVHGVARGLRISVTNGRARCHATEGTSSVRTLRPREIVDLATSVLAALGVSVDEVKFGRGACSSVDACTGTSRTTRRPPALHAVVEDDRVVRVA